MDKLVDGVDMFVMCLVLGLGVGFGCLVGFVVVELVVKVRWIVGLVFGRGRVKRLRRSL